ncbi:MAG TPA: glycoside hydrolase domain-containing protein, partial [Sphingomonas sp.]
VGGGKTLRIRAEGNGPDRPYIQSVRWNGAPWTKNWIAHAELVKGGELAFQMGTKPSSFGSGKADRPPSFGRYPA